MRSSALYNQSKIIENNVKCTHIIVTIDINSLCLLLPTLLLVSENNFYFQIRISRWENLCSYLVDLISLAKNYSYELLFLVEILQDSTRYE